MATSNNERVAKALDLLRQGLQPFVQRELKAAYGERAQEVVTAVVQQARPVDRANGEPHTDCQVLLNVMSDQWQAVFRNTLGQFERNLVGELRAARNRWAHQEAFSTDDAYRALDSAARLLSAVSAAAESTEVERQKQELLRLRFDEQARREIRRAAVAPTEGRPQVGLRPWREVITPHPDVASGRYQQAEFAADLGQVHHGEGSDEYLDPKEFFARTFLTDGLHDLLLNALRRLGDDGGDPVVELQTNFGGGKTHSMLALYHLFGGRPAADLHGIDTILTEAGLDQPPAARRAVLVGQALSPGQARHKPDGTLVHTLWGELAWQLGEPDGTSAEAYALVAEADRHGVSPGSDVLRDLFERYSPCLILIDEWLAYVRQLYHVEGLPAGSFDANLTFAQALTEAARQAPRTLVVAAIPSSDVEIGGEGGRQALARLENVFSRLESAWRPASSDEGFEIVRRRLFQNVADPELARGRDAVVRAFAELYRAQPSEFPSPCREARYEERLRAAYPIHPELFDRLFGDWSTLDRFQRTRGVLRLMAKVIHTLWERQDGGLLILPSSLPIDEHAVQSELTHYLDPTWVPVIERDVDGPNSLPLQLDRENPNLGRYSAARRVARTLFVGSAPSMQLANRGLDDRSLKLGCAQPGESPAIFGDGLRRLSDQATYLYVHDGRYWYSTQPSVTQLARDRAQQQSVEVVHDELIRRLRAGANQRGDFARVHAVPPSSGDVPDDPEARLVILGPEQPHAARVTDSKAREAAATLLDQRGNGPRLQKNALVFLAADRTRLAELEQATRDFLAWQSIERERETLNLDAYQSNQASTRHAQADDTVDRRIAETYHWLLVPTQEPTGPLGWEELRLQGDEPLAVRASRKLRSEESLIPQLSGTILRHWLDKIPLWTADHVGVKQLAAYFAQYVYLPRLQDSNVLLTAIQDGVGRLTWESETFAYADGYDDARQRYLGLRGGANGNVVLDEHSLLVRPEAARRQFDVDAPVARPTPIPFEPTRPDEGSQVVSPDYPTRPTSGGGQQVAERPRTLRRFHGAVDLDPRRMASQSGQVAQEVVQHLVALLGANVRVTLEIEADLVDGAPPDLVRTVTENCRTLRFSTQGFEES